MGGFVYGAVEKIVDYKFDEVVCNTIHEGVIVHLIELFPSDLLVGGLPCDHCYVYENADQSWRHRPRVGGSHSTSGSPWRSTRSTTS